MKNDLLNRAMSALMAVAIDASQTEDIAELAFQSYRALERARQKKRVPVTHAPRKRAVPSKHTPSGRLARLLQRHVEGKLEVPQDFIFKAIRAKKSQAIELGRAMTILGFQAHRMGKGERRRVVYVKP